MQGKLSAYRRGFASLLDLILSPNKSSQSRFKLCNSEKHQQIGYPSISADTSYSALNPLSKRVLKMRM